jgi:hypothetical protein
MSYLGNWSALITSSLDLQGVISLHFFNWIREVL